MSNQHIEAQQQDSQAHSHVKESKKSVAARKKRAVFQLYLSVWYTFGIIETLLALRFIFKMLGANRVGFIDFLYGITDPFALPFYGIFTNATNGKYLIEWTTFVAMAIYALITFGVIQFIRILTSTSPEEAEELEF